MVALSISTGLIWSEQRETAAQKLQAEINLDLLRTEQRETARQKQLAEDNLALVLEEQKKTAEQKRVAEKNYLLAREVGFTSIDLIESTQVELASNAGWQAKRKLILVTAARSCQRFLEQEPGDLQLQAKAAMIYRHTANFHRLETTRLPRSLSITSRCACKRIWSKRVPTSRRAWTSWRPRCVIRRACWQGRGNSTGQRRIMPRPSTSSPSCAPTTTPSPRLTARLLSPSSICRDRIPPWQHAEIQELAQSAADLFGELLDVPVQHRHPYDPLLQAMALTRVAVVQRDENKNLDKALKTHRRAAGIMTELAKAKPARMVPADIYHNQARCRLEQAISMARDMMRRADAREDSGGDRRAVAAAQQRL